MSHIRLLFLLILLGYVSMVDSATNTCPIPNTGKNGTEHSIFLSLYYCSKASSSPEAVCSPEPERNATLKKGEIVDMKYDVNGYAVTAEFFGDEICVAYRRVVRLWLSGRFPYTDECKSKCFREGEVTTVETYHTVIVCGNVTCGGGNKLLKFVATPSGAQSRVALALSVVISCVLTASSLAW